VLLTAYPSAEFEMAGAIEADGYAPWPTATVITTLLVLAPAVIEPAKVQSTVPVPEPVSEQSQPSPPLIEVIVRPVGRSK
jgi:hypothetical protein